MPGLFDRVEDRAEGGIIRGSGVAVADVVARLERGDALGSVRDALRLEPLDLVAALAYAGLGGDAAEGPTLAQVPPARPKLIPALREKSLAAIFPDASRPARLALAAGLLQIHDAWGTSHEAAQEADDLGETAVSAFWHGVAHRREPDASNALYWFRRVGRSHPAFGPLAEAARPLAEGFGDPAVAKSLFERGTWNPAAMVDLCTRSRPGTPAATLARRLQRREMIALLDATVAALA